jgi:hypothetical protein
MEANRVENAPRLVEVDDLSEIFVDLLYGVTATKTYMRIEFGVNRVDHRQRPPLQSSIPVARLIVTPKVARDLGRLLLAASEYAVGNVPEDQLAYFFADKPGLTTTADKPDEPLVIHHPKRM